MNTQPTLSGISDYFQKWEAEMPDTIFLRQPKGPTWLDYTWKAAGDRARKISGRLADCGFQRGDRIAILSQNCAEWIISDVAIVLGGYVSVPLYANVNAETMRNILTHSGSRLLFIGKLLDKEWDTIKVAMPESVMCVTLPGYDRPGITRWNEFMPDDQERARWISLSPDDLATIIYTSGTTGTPKGVVHTHGSAMQAVDAAMDWVSFRTGGNRFLSYLPLSHAAERGLVEFGSIISGGTISFVENQDSFPSNIQATQPTHFFGVPRIWEKFQSKILEQIPQSRLNLLLAIPGLAFLVKRKIIKALGLGQAKVILTGAAPIAPELLTWFQKIGISIREAYGMSENFNVCAMNPPGGIRIGSAGKLFDKQEIIIDPETGEILQRCAWAMKGYYNDPELTAQTLKDGYLHTGDIGTVSPDGYLTLAGRVKDIFKTSKGEYIAPGKIEMLFLSLKEVDQACVMGTLYPQPFIIVGLSAVGKLLNRATVIGVLADALNNCNRDVMEYQRVKKVIVVQEEWTSANNLLTPTLKMKRTALSSKYESALKMLYHTDEKVSFE